MALCTLAIALFFVIILFSACSLLCALWGRYELVENHAGLQTSAHSSAALPLTEPARQNTFPPSPRHARSSTLLSPPLSGAAISVRAL